MEKIVLITGATEGIGRATALGIARQPGYRVVIHGRDEAKARATVAYIRQESGNESVEYLLADFSSLTQVQQLADAVRTRFERLDVLINNAAGMFAERRVSADGLEMNFAVNYLATYHLTYLLLPILKQTPGARIINLSSVGYKQAKPNLDDLQAEHSYSMMPVYFNSKLFCLYFTLDLADELKNTGITVNAVHPGGVRTQLARDFKGPIKWLFAVMMPLFFSTPEQGAETSIYLATSSDLSAVTGTYFVKKKPERLEAIGEHRANRARLKAITERLLNSLTS